MGKNSRPSPNKPQRSILSGLSSSWARILVVPTQPWLIILELDPPPLRLICYQETYLLSISKPNKCYVTVTRSLVASRQNSRCEYISLVLVRNTFCAKHLQSFPVTKPRAYRFILSKVRLLWESFNYSRTYETEE